MKINYLLALSLMILLPTAARGMDHDHADTDANWAAVNELRTIRSLLQEQKSRSSAARIRGALWGLANLALGGAAGYLAYKKGFTIYQDRSRTGAGVLNSLDNIAAEITGTHKHRDRFFFNDYASTLGLSALALIFGTTGWNQLAQSDMIN